MAAKGQVQGGVAWKIVLVDLQSGHGQRPALYIRLALWVFKTYEPSKAESSQFCAAPVTVCQRKIENLCIYSRL